MDEELAEICGILIGDGCLSENKRYKECAMAGDITEEKDYYDSWVVPLFNKKIAIPLLNKEVFAKEYSKQGVYGIYVFNEKVVDFFVKLGFKTGKKTNVEIPETIMKSKDSYRFFLRGLFDTDGSVFFQKNNSVKVSKHKFPRIKLGSTSEKLIEQLKIMIESLGYSPNLPKAYKGKRDLHNMYYIEICKRKEVYRWIEEIGFKSPKHATKILTWRKLGYCPPNTTIKQRKAILNG